METSRPAPRVLDISPAAAPAPSKEEAMSKSPSPSRRVKVATAAVGATALVAVPLTVVLAGPASAAEKAGRCDGARIELSVEREDGGFEVEADVEDAPRNSRWKIVATHDGGRFVNGTATARDDDGDRDGDISIDRYRPNSAGTDTFRLTVNKVGTSGSCSLTIKTR